jgi:anti-sigma regulatory factor (Ser/Thr protein kinase)
VSTPKATYLEVRLPAVLASIRVINEILDVALRELKVHDALRHDVALGIAELVSNVHRHEYQGRDDGDVIVRIDLDANMLQVTVESHGPRFDPAAVAAPTEAPDPLDFPELESGGLGIPLLHGLFDEVRFGYEEGRGNLVVLRKSRRAS